MMTPQEVSQRAFAKATFGGYNMAMVDEFLDELTEDYSALYKENMLLKNKMKVLVDKIEEYRATEDAMRAALLSAQKMAAVTVEEAETRKAQIIREAEDYAATHQKNLASEFSQATALTEAAKEAAASFVESLRAQYEKGLAQLAEIEQTAANAPVLTPPFEMDPVLSVANEIEDSVSKMLEDEETTAFAFDSSAKTAAAPSDPAPTIDPLDAEVMEITRRIDFSSLRFGKDYEAE